MVHSPILQAGLWRRHKRRLLPAHRNLGLEVVYVAAGQALWQVEGRQERVLGGSVFYTLPWQEHGGVQEMQPGLSLYYAIIRLNKSYLKPVRHFELDASCQGSRSFSRQLCRTLIDRSQHAMPASRAMAWLMPQLVREYQSQPADNDAVVPLARLVLVELLRCASDEEVEDRATTAGERRVRRLLALMAQTCHEPWTLSRMAESADLSRTRLGDLVLKLTGDSPIMAINRMRIDKAQRLLKSRSGSITQVAMDCGFSSSQYFARTFKAYTGLTPRAYRG